MNTVITAETLKIMSASTQRYIADLNLQSYEAKLRGELELSQEIQGIIQEIIKGFEATVRRYYRQ